MKLEVLFPEICNLFGEQANVRYISASAPDIEVIKTDNRCVPRFMSERVDMIYMGAMSESGQELAIERLMPYKNRIRELIEDNVIILATGNSMEIFGEYISENDKRIEALGLFSYHAVRDLEHRHNSRFLGRFEDMEIFGHKSQFSFAYGIQEPPFIEITVGGYGSNPDDKFEGIRYKNFFGTYLLGPFLVLNPLFTKYLLRLMGHHDAVAFEKDALAAYRKRLEETKRPGTGFYVDEHG